MLTLLTWIAPLVPYAGWLYLALFLGACLLVWFSRLPQTSRPSQL
ncbi:hypothetical protein [Armatimonas rosea]|uniref:Uncharacterized protein n=1 Tax=Armatimonas rosea TaxID=685828 RepID=A0A7W9SQX1_ARMRO|nr:hypothetical protein [Armatimonas rosea]MBB6051157.1 hypothetical protein [Armatimonas rosea]